MGWSRRLRATLPGQRSGHRKDGFIYRPVYAAATASAGVRSFGSSSHGSSGYISPGFPLVRYDVCANNPGECLPPDGDPVVAGELVAWKTWTGTLNSWTAFPEGLGGWTLSAHHTYDSNAKIVRRGDGTTQAATIVDSHVVTTLAKVPWSTGIAAAPDGTLYAVEGWAAVDKIDRSGKVTRVAGGASCTVPQSGIPASQACLVNAYNVALGPDGSIYLPGTANSGAHASPVRRIRPDGIIEDFAGVHDRDLSTVPVGDEGPALQARIGIAASVAAAPDGSVYILADDRIRKVTPDGIIHAFAGTGAVCCQYGSCGTCCNGGDNGPAVSAQICGGGNYGTIAVGPDGSVYLGDRNYAVIRRIRPDGIIERFAGTTFGSSGDGGSAKSARFVPTGVWVAPDNSLYIADGYNQRVRRISPAGIIETISGSGQLGYTGDGGPALAATFHDPYSVVTGPDGDLFIADSSNYVVRRVGAPLPGFTLAEFTVAAEDGHELYVFSSTGRHLRTLDAVTKAVVFEFGYDSSGRLASVKDRDGLMTAIERSGGVPVAIVAPHGQRTSLSVDGNGYLNAVANPAGETKGYSYDGDGLMQTFTDARRNVHTFRHDDLGRLFRDENPGGGSKQLSRTDRADGYLISVTTALGRSTLHDVKQLGTGDEVRMLTQPDGTAFVSTSYTSGGKTSAWPDGTIASTMLGPDPQFAMQSPLRASSQVTTPGGVTRSASHTASVVLADPKDVLSVKTRTDQLVVNGRTSTAVYDAAAQTVTTTTAQGRKTVATLDPAGRIASLQPPGVPLLSFGRDATGQLQTVAQGSRVSMIDYETAGLPWRVTDPAGRQVQLGYDTAGRLASETLPGSRTVGFGYDASGNLSSITPPGQPAHGFTADAVDRLGLYTPPFVPGAGSLSTTYGYDADGALSQVLLPDSTTIVPGYDSAGRLATVTTARGVAGVGYDTAGRVQSLSTPEGNWLVFGYDGFLPTSETATGLAPGVVSRTFDNDFRERTISVNGAAVATFSYDGDGLLTQAGALSVPRDPATGRITSTSLGAVTATPAYNAYGEQDSLTAKANGSTVYAYTLHRDASGKIVGKTETVQGVTSEYVYAPDAAGRLWTVTKDGVTVESYSYDDNGNRLSGTNSASTATGTYDAQDRMTAYGAPTYTYGPSGDLRTKMAGGQTTTYSYESLGNLMGVWLTDGRVIEYVVDGLNRRVGKKVNGAMVEGFLYDGQLRPVAWLDGAGAVTATFVYGLHVNVPEYMTISSGTYRILHDHLGSPRLVVDTTSGAVVQRMDYDSFGNVLSDSAPGFQPFGFAGGLYDRDTGLVRFGARDYDPSVGRWTNKDPIRFEGGLNLYEYCEGDPLNLIDPYGDAGGPFIPEPPGGPPFPVPGGGPGTQWKWFPDPGNGRGGAYYPDPPVPGPSQPGANWEPNGRGHWDFWDGRGGDRWYDRWGNRIDGNQHAPRPFPGWLMRLPVIIFIDPCVIQPSLCQKKNLCDQGA